MGHGRLRHDNTCLNCGSIVRGRYCSNCGQENIEPKETLAGLISHFIADITHFDGKFFSTCRYLITLPGFLPKEYVAGRRARYLHPIKMYVFTSALFFLIFFSVFTVKHIESDAGTPLPQLDSVIAEIEAEGAASDIPNLRSGYRSARHYDSVQRILPPGQRDNWIERRISMHGINLTERYKNDTGQLIKDLLNKFFHSFPSLLFISLPLFALYLKFIFRSNRELYYTDHGVFLIYLYIFTFLLLLILIGLNKLRDVLQWRSLNWLSLLAILFGIYYAYAALRRFYGQSRGKTILKLTLFSILSGTTLLLLFAIFFVLTIFQI